MTPTKKIGINTLSPAEALDVDGSIQTSENLIVQGTTDSASIGTGAVKISGGVGIAKKLFVGTDLNVAGSSTQDQFYLVLHKHILRNKRKKVVLNHAVEFRGNLIGNITGTVTGGATNANKLYHTPFELTGDVSPNPNYI